MKPNGLSGNRYPIVLPEGYEGPKQNVESAWIKLSQRISEEVQRIYYPCCFEDRLPSRLFPWAQVTYLDNNPQSFRNDSDSSGLVGDANGFVCTPRVDLGILQNPTFYPEGFLDSVESWKYVIANDYHASARFLLRQGESILLWSENLKSGTWLDARESEECLQGLDESDPFSLNRDSLYLFRKK